MSIVKPVIYDNGQQRQLAQGDVLAAAEIITTLATNGAGALTGPILASTIINRTTVATAVADTTATANEIVTAIASNASAVSAGSTWRTKYRNNSTGIITLTGGTGVTIAGTAAIPAGASADLLVSIDNATATSVVAGAVTNTSATVTGLTLAQTSLISVGQLCTGADIPASTTVLAVIAGSGVTLSNAATGTSALEALTFAPKVTITNIGMTAAAQSPTAQSIVAITTVGAGTITAAGIVAGIVTRSGPVAAYSDATDTAVAIIAAMPVGTTGSSVITRIRNTVPFAQTLTAGAGVTLAGETVLPGNSEIILHTIITAATTVTTTGISVQSLTVQPIIASTALTTNGAGTITAAGVAAGLTVRTVPTSVFTDTTDTAVAIVAALPSAMIGQSFTYIYQNKTAVLATIAGGAGVTVSSGTKVPAATWIEYLVTLTSLTAVTMIAIGAGDIAAVPNGQYVTSAASGTTLSANDMEGARISVLNLTANGANAIVTRTAAELLAAIPNATVGFSWKARIISAGNNTVTLTGGTGVTITGTATIATSTYTDFILTILTATTVSMQVIGAGTKI